MILQRRALLAQMLFILFGDQIQPHLRPVDLFVHSIIILDQPRKMRIMFFQRRNFLHMIWKLFRKSVGCM